VDEPIAYKGCRKVFWEKGVMIYLFTKRFSDYLLKQFIIVSSIFFLLTNCGGAKKIEVFFCFKGKLGIS
jgi:hypothetical protein